MAESVKVAVRVRPFNQREKDRNAKMIISMAGPATTITNPQSKVPKTFTFDYSFYSHDHFTAGPDGYCSPDGTGEPAPAGYADQQMVYEGLGKMVLNNAYGGFNSSLFAYGQTGAGKSYSMVGYGTNKGIVPLACASLFETIGTACTWLSSAAFAICHLPPPAAAAAAVGLQTINQLMS